MSLHGWTSIRMWAIAISMIPDQRQIIGYPVMTGELASRLMAAGDPWNIAARLRHGFPEDVSRDLLSLEGSVFAARMARGLPPRFERRLMQEAVALCRQSLGQTTPIQPLFRFGYCEPATETAAQLLTRQSSLEEGLNRLAEDVARLSKGRTVQPFLFAVSRNFLTSLENARKRLATLQSHYRIIINSPLAVTDPSPTRYRAVLEGLETSLRQLEEPPLGILD